MGSQWWVAKTGRKWMRKVAIIDYGVGNLRSVQRGIERAGATPTITADPEEIRSAAGIILPGVGAFREGMEMLGTLQPVVCEVAGGTPLLGICLGMQMLMEWSEERGVHQGLRLIPGIVTRFPPCPPMKVPHMGWNTIQKESDDPLLEGLSREEYVYFVHSYYVTTLTQCTIATTEYLRPFSSAIHRDGIYGVQFHPEKSGAVGLQLLKNFIDLL